MDRMQDPSYLEIHIKTSKTDPFCKGVHIYLGVSGADICLVASILSYTVQQGAALEPLFVFADWRFFTWQLFVQAVRQALEAKGVLSAWYAGQLGLL